MLSKCSRICISDYISFHNRFDHVLPDTSNIAGTLANANFIASLITTFIILAFACEYKTMT